MSFREVDKDASVTLSQGATKDSNLYWDVKENQETGSYTMRVETDDDVEEFPVDVMPSSGVARYAFEEDVSDSWGSFDGTDNTSDGYSSGQVGDFAKDFDGTDDYVSIPTNFGIFDGSQDFSVATWLNFPNITVSGGAEYYIGFRGENGVRAGVNGNNNIEFQIIDSNINTYTPTSTGGYAGQWVHAVGVFNSGGDVILHINGSSEDSVSGSVSNINSSSEDSAIGVDKDGNEKYFPGTVDDVRIYDKALTSTEVSNLYNNDSI